jgi:hypothetical protein
MELERFTRPASLKFCPCITDTHRHHAGIVRTCIISTRRRAVVFLRIGAFGATRPLPNFMNAAGAAVEVATQLHANLELWVSAGRVKGRGREYSKPSTP